MARCETSLAETLATLSAANVLKVSFYPDGNLSEVVFMPVGAGDDGAADVSDPMQKQNAALARLAAVGTVNRENHG